ncbi:MAG: two-component sensor histidine kinase [Helicobacteraceae bacterium CG2_30_36_10]|nr:MAG: two-component sensor histidine kinase [Helicobacteraceae bacterium CG2_30_36_10]
MNSLEKKSLYSFLALYLGSSLLFVLLSGFWYYSAQKSSLENTVYYKLQHLADRVAGVVINAQMMNKKLTLPKAEEGYEYSLIPIIQQKVYEQNYFEKDGFKVLVSSAVQEHLAMQYVVVKTDEYHKKLTTLQREVLVIMGLIFAVIVIISFILSKLFMRPIHEKISQIEAFIQDISHELNTPITALKMSSKRALQKQVYDAKILTNISISTKQLYSIYQSLSYLNFAAPKQSSELLDLKAILMQSIEYYAELTRAKEITIKTDIEESYLSAVESRVGLLFSNLISNAIKYSMPNTTITITLKENFFSIKDEGIGIAKEKHQLIFKSYVRGSNIAGGFGIGLSIVKQICDEFGIKIELSSKLEKGSCFTLKW